MHEMTSDAVTNARKYIHVRIANDAQKSLLIGPNDIVCYVFIAT